MKQTLQYTILFLLWGLLMCSCSEKSESWSEPYEPGYDEEYDDTTVVSGYSGTSDKAYETDTSITDRKQKAEEGEKSKETDADTGGKKEKPEERQKVYFGFLKLLVQSIKESKSSISTLAEEKGGFVESSYGEVIIIRVPKEEFDNVFTTLTGYGEVLDRSIETYDVTEFFQDLSSRLEISEKTRKRLYELLEKTRDVKERLKILKEIRRLSEEIEKIKLTLESIKRLIAYSRITIELKQRLADLSQENKSMIPFPWISALDPFGTTISRLDGKMKIDLGDDFAIFDDSKFFFAESTDGIRIRAGTIHNFPRGDGQFWQQALSHHLAPFYKTTESIEQGNVGAVLFTSKDLQPFSYLVGVIVKDKKLHVIEVLFPDPTSYEEKGEEVKNYIKECTIQ
jgi:hypothetical protein